MTTNCSSCDSHAHHAAIALIEMVTCEDNDLESVDQALQYLDEYSAQLLDDDALEAV